MTDGVIIETASLSDARAVAELAINIYESEPLEALVREFERFCADGESAVFVRREDGRPIAFAHAQLRHDYVEGTESSPVGYLEGVFVLEEFRRRGVARALVGAAEAWARGMGCSEFASDCELSNELSLAFHLAVGFIEANRVICFSKRI